MCIKKGAAQRRKAARIKSGLSVEKLAFILDVSERTVRRYEMVDRVKNDYDFKLGKATKQDWMIIAFGPRRIFQSAFNYAEKMQSILDRTSNTLMSASSEIESLISSFRVTDR